MAKELLLGIDNVSRNVPEILLGIDGTARQVIEGYIGDENGTARLFYEYLKYLWKKYSVVTTYKWNKYNAASRTTYSESSLGSGSRSWSQTATQSRATNPYVTDSGSWGGFGSSASIENCIGYWVKSGNTIYYVSSFDIYTDTMYYSQSKTITSNTTYYNSGTLVNTVTSTSSSAYPSNGRSGSYWYVSAGSTQSQGTYIEDVKSADPSAYPDNGVSGSYWYVKQS